MTFWDYAIGSINNMSVYLKRINCINKRIIIKEKQAHRITGLFTLRRLTAARAPKNRSRACALCAVLSPPQFGQGTFATQSPVTCPNRQLPETLCEIPAQISVNIIEYGLTK